MGKKRLVKSHNSCMKRSNGSIKEKVQEWHYQGKSSKFNILIQQIYTCTFTCADAKRVWGKTFFYFFGMIIVYKNLNYK